MGRYLCGCTSMIWWLLAASFHVRRCLGRRLSIDDVDGIIAGLGLPRNDDDCPPDGDKCCDMGDRWQTSNFLRQSLGMGIEGCFQANIDLAQVFASGGLFVPIQLVFAIRGVYDFGLGAGSSGTEEEHKEAAERRKLTGEVSAAVQVTVIPKAFYIYVSMTYQLQAYQRQLNSHPYILSVKEIVSLITRVALGKKYLSMRFVDKPKAQQEFVASLLDMYTFTHGFPTDDHFLNRFEVLVDTSSRHMTWPKRDADLNQLTVVALRSRIYKMANELKTKYSASFWNVVDPVSLFDCYSYYEAMLDVVYASNIALTGEDAISVEQLQTARNERDSANNRYNETFAANGFSSGGKRFSKRGKHKRVNTDPLWLCDKHQNELKCRERLAMCMSLNYKPIEDFIAPEWKGKWPNQVLNSFPEVVDAVNGFEMLHQTSKQVKVANAELIQSGMKAISTIVDMQPTFFMLYRAKEGTVNACLVRDCSDSTAGEETGAMIVDDLRDDRRGSDEVERTMSSEVRDAVNSLISAGVWSSGLPPDASRLSFYYSHAPPSAPGKGLGSIASCIAGNHDACNAFCGDVRTWSRSEENLWKAMESGDASQVQAACQQPELQIHARNPFKRGMTFLEKANASGVEEVLRSCPNFLSNKSAKPARAPTHFRPYVVQRLWMRTVTQAYLAIDQYHRELKAEGEKDDDATVAKAFYLEYTTTVSFAATLDLSYIDFCKATGAPVAFEGGITRSGKLRHEFSPEKGTYVLYKEDDLQLLKTKQFQLVEPDGSVKFFAEWGKGMVEDDFDLVNIEKKYMLQMSTPLVMTAFVAALGLNPLLERLSPLVSRTMTGQVVEAVESKDGLTLSSLEEMIVRAWEKQTKANASSAVTTWFEDIGAKLLRASHSGMTCDLSIEAVAAFLFRMLTYNSVHGVASYLGNFGAQKAKDLYETAPAYAGAWFLGRLDMLVSHTSQKCHKMLRPQLKAFFRAGFNAPVFSGAYTAAFVVRLSLPMTPKNMILPEAQGRRQRKQWCGILGNPGKKRMRSCAELYNIFIDMDKGAKLFLSREELLKGFGNPRTVDMILRGEEQISWTGFFTHFELTEDDCREVNEHL